MKTRLIALLLPAVLSATNLAMAQSPSAPYPGVVTGSNVYVRSGPNMGSYPVTKLGESDQVTVVERLSDEWLAIQPVRGCYGVISAQYVQPDAAGKIGTILGNGVLVRAAGELRTRNFDNPLGKRNRGDRVRLIGRVVGTDGKIEWYVIKPPEDMRFYISARFVRSAEEPAETEEESPAAARTPAAPSEAPAAMAAPVSQELEALRAIRALEKELVTESNKPVEQRNFADILSRAEKIRLPENSRFAPIHKSLMQYIREEVALVENTRQTERQVEAVLRQAAEKRDQAIKTTAPTESPKTSDPNRLFDLEGVLSVSALYTLADPNQPRRYVVRTPDTKAIVGYVQSSKGKVRLEDFVGKSVGIRGKITYDGSISMKILEADSVTSLAQMTEKVPAERLAAERQAKPVEPEPTEPLVEEPKPTEPEPTEPLVEEPKPTEPEPAEPLVEEPKPTEPEPAEPLVEEPKPTEPELAEPLVEEPKPVEPEPTEPLVEEPKPTEPEPTEPLVEEPKPSEPEPAEPLVEEPKPSEPEPAEPLVEEPKPTEPEPAEPLVEEPKPSEPEPTEPLVEEPKPTEPEPAEPLVEEPKPTEPEPAEPQVEEPQPLEPTPVVKTPKPEPGKIELTEPEKPAAPVQPTKVEPAEIKPMEIQPIDVVPTKIDSPIAEEAPTTPVKPSRATAAPAKAAEPEPMPADQPPEPEMKIYEVQTTEGDVEVEWD